MPMRRVVVGTLRSIRRRIHVLDVQAFVPQLHAGLFEIPARRCVAHGVGMRRPDGMRLYHI